MMIIKSTGERVPFRAEKISETLRRIGAKEETIQHVAQKVTSRVRDGMTTRDVHRIVRKELHREDRCMAHRYNLRSGLLKLGPAGFKFEKYVASILQAYQYAALVPDGEMRGLCVMHEVDVIAEKNGRRMLIEAKFRNKFDDPVTLKDALATWARFGDLQDGAKAGTCPKFDEVWIVTNGRFSDRAAQFGTCKGMRMVDWGSPDHSLARMVDHAVLYPVTVLEGLRQWELERFSDKGLMLCRQLTTKKPTQLAQATGISGDRAAAIISECKEIVAERH